MLIGLRRIYSLSFLTKIRVASHAKKAITIEGNITSPSGNTKCEKVKVFCPTCQEIVSLLNYSRHTQDHYKKCFNCGHICTESEDANKIKVGFLSIL